MSMEYREALESLTRIRGVVGGLLVSREDGLVVAEAAMDGVAGNAVAALTNALAGRMQAAVASGGFGDPSFFHLHADGGTIAAAPAGDELLVVVIADRRVNVGLLRLEMLRIAGSVA